MRASHSLIVSSDRCDGCGSPANALRRRWPSVHATQTRTPATELPAGSAAKEPAPPPSVTVIGARDAHGILGRDVRSAANENMGRIVE